MLGPLFQQSCSMQLYYKYRRGYKCFHDVSNVLTYFKASGFQSRSKNCDFFDEPAVLLTKLFLIHKIFSKWKCEVALWESWYSDSAWELFKVQTCWNNAAAKLANLELVVCVFHKCQKFMPFITQKKFMILKNLCFI